jgi:hypothetical protein
LEVVQQLLPFTTALNSSNIATWIYEVRSEQRANETQGKQWNNYLISEPFVSQSFLVSN